MSDATILLVGYSPAWQQVMGTYRAGDTVTFVEEPDVVRKRDIRASLARTEPACELVEWEYQRPAAADRFYVAHRDLRPAAIVPVVEYAVAFAARLAERYGVPGAGGGAVELLCDKHLLRQVAAEAAIPNPRSRAVDGPGDVLEFMREHGGPVVLKPANRQASVGTRVLRELEEVQAAWRECVAQDEGIFVPDRPRALRMLVEQFVEGDEFSVELLVRDREALFCNVTGKLLFPGARPVEQAHTVPASIPPELTKLLRGETLRVLDAVGFHTGFVHCEWIVRRGVPYLVECAGRMPGDSIVPLIMQAWQADVLGWFLSVMRGDALEEVPPTHAPGGAAAWFLHVAPGEVVAIRGLEQVRAMEGVTSADVVIQPGDRTRELRSSWDRAGCVLTAAATADAALVLARRAAEAIVIDTVAHPVDVAPPEPPLEPDGQHEPGQAKGF
jgi:biotin carboxylase